MKTCRMRWTTIVLASLASLASLAALAGCANVGDAGKPLPVHALAAPCPSPVDTLIVLLPGAYDHGDEFLGEGFVDAVRARNIAADVALVDAGMAYYRERNVVDRLAAEVVAPARARGIRHVWFAGISLGGLGSLIYANERRGEVDGLLVIAPYLGEPPVVAEVGSAGGVARWSPPATMPPADTDHRLWAWLKTLTARPADPALPSVYLGFGRDDRFAAAHRLFAAALPPERVFSAPGGHDWPAWKAVWNDMLDAAPLPHDAGCRALR